MPMCAFFPWYTPPQGSLSCAEFMLRSFGDSGQANTVPFERLRDAYRVGGAPIRTITCIRFEDLDWQADLNEERRGALFVFSELLATCGIASRTLFEPFGYQNRDNFRLFIQSYDGTSGGVTITSRRRDGQTDQYWSSGRHRVEMPDHVHLDSNPIDEPLLNALLALRDDPARWPHCFDAVAGFNLANTDRGEIAVHLETVLLISAFERLLQCKSNEHDLADALVEVLQPSSATRASDSAILQSEQHASLARCPSVGQAWIRDFYRLRGSLAHGNLSQSYKPAWSTQAHMLVGSIAFPLALKRILQKCGIYQWMEGDQQRLDTFEALLCEDIFSPPDGQGRYPLTRIQSDFARRRRLARAQAIFESRSGGVG